MKQRDRDRNSGSGARRAACGASAGLLVVLVAACGGGGDGETSAVNDASVTKVPLHAGDPDATKQPGPEDLANFKAPPRKEAGARRPNFRGGDAPLPEFLTSMVADDADWWQFLANQNKIKWPTTAVTVTTGPAETACGTAKAGLYCPKDETIYLPASWFERKVLPAGDTIVAAVIGKIYSYRVQHVLGRSGPDRPRKDVNLEATCLAGNWMASLDPAYFFDEGDLDELEASVVPFMRRVPDPEGGDRGTLDENGNAFVAGFFGGLSPGKCLHPETGGSAGATGETGPTGGG